MELVLVVMVVAGMVGTVVGADQKLCKQEDALFVVKGDLGGGPYFDDWNNTKDCCQWRGVSCNVGGMVTRINVTTEDINTPGRIPDNLAKFKALETLVIGNNLPNIGGPIPDGIKDLANLTYLGITGTNLSGQIPPVLGQIVNLEALVLSNNYFTSGIDSLASATKLTILDLSKNLLGSPLPATLPSALKALNLSGNKFDGEIPPLNNWGSLEGVDLSHNQLSGSLETLFTAANSLKNLSLADNKFRFNMSAVGLSTGLIDLDLSHNQIYWTISQQVNDLKSLSKFSVSNNLLFGPIPSKLSKMPASAFDNNICLCGPPLEKCPPCFDSLKTYSRGDAPIIHPTSMIMRSIE